MSRSPTAPVNTFLRSTIAMPVTVPGALLEYQVNSKELARLCIDMHTRAQSITVERRKQSKNAAPIGQLPNFVEGVYVFLSCSGFHAEKICLRWRGPRRVRETLNGFVYQVEALRNGQLDDIHASRLYLFCDSDIDETTVMSHVLQSETDMVVSRLLRLEECPYVVHVRVQWNDLGNYEDALESIARVSEDIPKLFDKLPQRKSTSVRLVARARAELTV